MDRRHADANEDLRYIDETCSIIYNMWLLQGALCEIDINECETDPCERGGTCVNTPGSFVCHCPKGLVDKQYCIQFNVL
jgi:hypothetical protein